MAPPAPFDQAYRKAVFFITAVIADAVFFTVVAEGFVWWRGPFEGFLRTGSLEPLRLGVYGGALAQMFVIRFLANRPLKPIRIDSEAETLARLWWSTAIVGIDCELILIAGLLLFFATGQRADFYVPAGLALFYLAVFRPRPADWREWIAKATQGGASDDRVL